MLCFLYLDLMTPEEKIHKEMMLRMIMRCNKVRKHKPKKVKETVLKVENLDSKLFPESEIQKKEYYSRSSTSQIRNNLWNLLS